jgi:hypothetical protein
LGIVLILNSNKVFELWLLKDPNIIFDINLLSLSIVLILSFTSIFIQILNGLDIIKVQFYFAIVSILFFLPFTNFLIDEFDLGIIGIIISLLVFNINGILIAPFQLYNFLKK